jgi:hypothetical protein
MRERLADFHDGAMTSAVIARSVSDEAIQFFRVRGSGLLRGACHRAALRADPLARMTLVKSMKVIDRAVAMSDV